MSSLISALFVCWLFHDGTLSAHAITQGPTNSYISVVGKTLPGPMAKESVKFARNLTLNQCAAECSLEYHLKQFPCYAFQYAPTTKICFLTNVTTLMLKGGYLGLRPNTSMMYFERSKGMYLNLYQPFPNQVLQQQSSYFAVFHNKTLEKCAMFCLLESRDTCMSFSYSATRRVCGLSKAFYADGNGQKLIKSSEYNHYQYFTTWPCNATIPWNYSPRALASPYFPYASITDVNCWVKIEAPLGQQVDLTFSTFFTQKNDICSSKNYGIRVIDGSSNNGTELSKLCSSDRFDNRRFVSTSGYIVLTFATGSTPFAFKAIYDFKTVDPCSDNPCKHGSTCTPQSGQFVCICLPGYTGVTCGVDIDECSSNPCYFGGQCADEINDYRCECQKMFGGKRCDQYVGLCYSHPCRNGGTCTHRGVDSYSCTCPKGFTGRNCTHQIPDPCNEHPCLNGATCQADMDLQNRSCVCAPGFTGSSCESDINECDDNPCLHNIPCTDLINDFKCECPQVMTGKICETFIGRCYESDCTHGSCRPTGRDNYTCDCDAGYIGAKCDVMFIDFCQPNPCKHGTCLSFENGPVCTCDLGYDGLFCDHKTDYCKGIDCLHGECVSNDLDFACHCLPGYQGKYCNETINHCLSADCNGGFCINTISSHFCVCRNGKTGLNCEAPTKAMSLISTPRTTHTYHSNSNTTLPSLDICSTNSCQHGSCELNICVCDAGFSGDSCDVFKGCQYGNPCLHGQCKDELNQNYICHCDPAYTGSNCDVMMLGSCTDSPCQNGGLCLDMNPGYQCACTVQFTGNNCELINACHTDPCIVGKCQPVGNTFRCRLDAVVGHANLSIPISLPGWPEKIFVQVLIFSRLIGDFPPDIGATGFETLYGVTELLLINRRSLTFLKTSFVWYWIPPHINTSVTLSAVNSLPLTLSTFCFAGDTPLTEIVHMFDIILSDYDELPPSRFDGKPLDTNGLQHHDF